MISLRPAVAVVLCLMVATLPLQSAPPDTGQHAGQINALIPAATRNSQPTKVKDDLLWNDLLQTTQSGRLRAGLTDGSILSLGSNSQLRVVQHDAASQQTSLEMDYGKVRNRVVKITQPNGKYEVKTPNAVIGVIGTDFYVGYANNKTTVICYSGVVTATPLAAAKVMQSSGQSGPATNGNSVTLNPGQMVEITSEIPAAGFQPQPTPPAVQKASIEDTDVPVSLEPVITHAHLVRNLIIGLGVAATGWAVGVTQLRQKPGPPPPPPVLPGNGCPPGNPKC